MTRTANDILLHTDYYQRLGGSAGMNDEARLIVRETIRTRLGEVVNMAFELTAKALLTRAPGAELRPVGNGYWIEDVLPKKFGASTLKAYRSSARSKNSVPRDLLRSIDRVVLPISFLVLIEALGLSVWCRWQKPLTLGVIVLAGVVANTVLCAVVSGIYDRYQYRVSWLTPFAATPIVLHLTQARSKSDPTGGRDTIRQNSNAGSSTIEGRVEA